MRVLRFFLIPALAALAVGLQLSCQPAGHDSRYVKDGVAYGVTSGLFNHRWWNYYQRGVSFAEGEFWQEAESDLQLAAKKNGEDNRNAQTYGMHFIDYYPHRELGIVYYRQSKLDTAEKELLLSLQGEDSARAHYYLAEVRAARLRQSGGDTTPPQVQLAAAGIYYSSREHIALTGRLLDNSAVRSYAIDNIPYYVRQPGGDIPFQYNKRLERRRSCFVIAATDLVGNTTVREMTCVLDRTGPFLSLQAPMKIANGWRVRGEVFDNEALDKLLVDGKAVRVADSGAFEVIVHTGVEKALVLASDKAGNRTMALVNLNGDMNGVGWNRLPDGSQLAARANAEYAKIKLVKKPPATVTTNYVALHLDLSCESEISRVVVAGEPINGLPKKGNLRFSYVVELDEGANSIRIFMQTVKGATASRMLHVRRVDDVKPLREHRMGLAYYELTAQGAKQQQHGRVFNELYEFHLAAMPRFAVLARKQLERVVLERKLNMSQLTDPKYRVKLSGLKGADMLVSGKLRVRSSGIEAESRLVDVRTGLIDAAVDVYHEKTDRATLDMLARALCLETGRRFPVVHADVNEVVMDGKGLLINKGTADGLREGLSLVVYSREGFNTTVYGYARLDSVKESRSRAVIESRLRDDPLPTNLEVVTR
jgi:tetratricopeptide (TPR) repeat protein